jgi:transglutaminase-like putative cysteine protease
MRYTVRHITHFTYESAITESAMEVRMQPRSDGLQRCIHFALTTTPASRMMMYQDSDGNAVHHFNIPGRHAQMALTAEALVDCEAPPTLPPELDPHTWTELDAMASSGEAWDYFAPSTFARPTTLLDEFVREAGLRRERDPVTTLRTLMREMFARFEYSPRSTRVDSPIDDALTTRRGVCQDFAHIFTTIARSLGIPTRYVSGYFFHDPNRTDRAADGATHAWVESLLPTVGWVGFDPTNDVLADDRHIRVAIGRDYADVPPTRGVYKGVTTVNSALAVSVRVDPARSVHTNEVVTFTPWMSRDAAMPALRDVDSLDAQQLLQQQQQQQQQQ